MTTVADGLRVAFSGKLPEERVDNDETFKMSGQPTSGMKRSTSTRQPRSQVNLPSGEEASGRLSNRRHVRPGQHFLDLAVNERRAISGIEGAPGLPRR